VFKSQASKLPTRLSSFKAATDFENTRHVVSSLKQERRTLFLLQRHASMPTFFFESDNITTTSQSSSWRSANGRKVRCIPRKHLSLPERTSIGIQWNGNYDNASAFSSKRAADDATPKVPSRRTSSALLQRHPSLPDSYLLLQDKISPPRLPQRERRYWIETSSSRDLCDERKIPPACCPSRCINDSTSTTTMTATTAEAAEEEASSRSVVTSNKEEISVTMKPRTTRSSDWYDKCSMTKLCQKETKMIPLFNNWYWRYSSAIIEESNMAKEEKPKLNFPSLNTRSSSCATERMVGLSASVTKEKKMAASVVSLSPREPAIPPQPQLWEYNRWS